MRYCSEQNCELATTCPLTLIDKKNGYESLALDAHFMPVICSNRRGEILPLNKESIPLNEERTRQIHRSGNAEAGLDAIAPSLESFHWAITESCGNGQLAFNEPKHRDFAKIRYR
jgi:hypothetical protein